MVVLAAALAALGAGPAAAKRKVTVVASFYPLAWAAQQAGGDRVTVTDLTPPGGEPHDLELSPDDRDAIDSADLVIILGGGFQPAVEDAAAQRDGRTLVIIDELSPADRRHVRRDPHLWLDPQTMAEVVTTVARAVKADGRVHLRQELDALDADYADGLATCDRDVIVTSHEAFGWLARRYGLRQQAIAGIDPESEPSPDRLAKLADLVKKKGVTTIFTEDLVSPKIAQTLAREAGGVRIAVLSPLESLTKAQRARGDDYLDVMRENLSQLQRALGCS